MLQLLSFHQYIDIQSLNPCFDLSLHHKLLPMFIPKSPLCEVKPSVCVTGGASPLSLAVVNLLLARRYRVRIILRNQDDVEKLEELKNSGAFSLTSIVTVTADPNSIESLVEAFHECVGVFHTSDFIDPAGLSGYTQSMAKIEEKTTENVMEACARTTSVKKCVLTSSLTACIWRDRSSGDLSPVIDQNSWSDESLCCEKKLWYALGKQRAEKAAWRISLEKKIELATICPALITGDDYASRNPTSTFAYLKGGKEMFESGLLATIEVSKVADAHVRVFESMNSGWSGRRYLCYDAVVERREEAEKLAKRIGIPASRLVEGSENEFVRRIIVRSTIPMVAQRSHLHCYSHC